MRFPFLYQANARLWLAELTQTLRRQATLDDIPDADLIRLQNSGFDWLYLICIWETGELETAIARRQTGLQEEAFRRLGKSGPDELCASCFAISGYQIPETWGGREALSRLRKRLHDHGLRLMLDFIPNHTGISHPWARTHPDYYVNHNAKEETLPKEEYVAVDTDLGRRCFAHGRDPYFPPWIDTLQLNYGNPELQRLMSDVLLQLAEQCDGLRCDMAMLALPEVFEKTWGIQAEPFWPMAIARVRETHPEFVFLAEVYWGLEGELLEQGFDYTYDKALYDRVLELNPARVRDQILGELSQIEQLAHFLENHDEIRAAAALPPEAHPAAALLTYLLPGMRFFHSGQEFGFRMRNPVQFCRPSKEPEDHQLAEWYRLLLNQIRLISCQKGSWKILTASPAWEGDQTWQNFILYNWTDDTGEHWLAAVNYSAQRSCCYAHFEFPGRTDLQLKLKDVLNDTTYYRSAIELTSQGLFLDRPGWGFHLFAITQERE